ncbi:MAG: ETX/MTX2 family pore-forming toxin [Corticimicrobacter sp.]|uniref:ETX/MTX2 family pore-forming toxin n=1 Tax=Corticimicrobacter sp. TaxID=2678536 RepID=UPI0032D9AE2E
MAELNYGSIVGVFSSDGRLRLDIGTWGLKKNIPANHDSWATRLVIRRLDGPNTGTVAADHTVGIFSEDGRVRLDIGNWAMQREVPASHESWATRLVIRKLDGTGAGTPVRYGDLIGIFSEDGKFRLDIGIDAVKKEILADHDSYATRFHIQDSDPVVDFEIDSIEYDLERATIDQVPLVVLQQAVTNSTDIDQECELSGSESVTETSSWSDTLGIKAGIKSSLKVQVPLLGEGGVELSAEASQSYTSGGCTSRQRTVAWKATIKVLAHHYGSVSVLVMKGNVIVPFVLKGTFIHKSGRREPNQSVTGSYAGSNAYKVDVRYVSQTPADTALKIENISAAELL